MQRIEGSIPACAGEAAPAACVRAVSPVYPRVCGGSLSLIPAGVATSGLSPRVRGKRVAIGISLNIQRSIPACAGEAGPDSSPLPDIRVYPRVCGGSPAYIKSSTIRRGLSPRVRGKPPVGRHCEGHRSIPACAGEACRNEQTARWTRVYPRVCGGSLVPFGNLLSVLGLSPRVRGKPASCRSCRCWRRSIPACAGEACWRGTPGCRCRVYPRVCGGSGCSRRVIIRWLGLSPRVRGKR